MKMTKYNIGDMILFKEPEFGFEKVIGKVININSTEYIISDFNRKICKKNIISFDSLPNYYPKKFTYVSSVTIPISLPPIETKTSLPVIDTKPTKNVYVSRIVEKISDCVHGPDCERLSCPKRPKHCVHGPDCERFICKYSY